MTAPDPDDPLVCINTRAAGGKPTCEPDRGHCEACQLCKHACTCLDPTNLAEAIRSWFEDNAGTHQTADAATGAVFALLKLHRPMDAQRHFGDTRQSCMACDDGTSTPRWPCPTLTAITNAIRQQDTSFSTKETS